MTSGASSTAQVKTATKTWRSIHATEMRRDEGSKVRDEGAHLAAEAHILRDLLNLGRLELERSCISGRHVLLTSAACIKVEGGDL